MPFLQPDVFSPQYICARDDRVDAHHLHGDAYLDAEEHVASTKHGIPPYACREHAESIAPPETV